MYQKDYILRMIEMLGELLNGILGLIKKKEFDEAGEKIEEIYYKMLKEDAAFFRNIPVEKLTETLLQDHNFTNGHLEILAELFNVEAELQDAKGDRLASMEYSRKALLLYEFTELNQRTYSFDKEEKMAALKKRIESLTSI